jgi:hypothetical protein
MHHHLECYSLERMLVAYSEGVGNEVEKTSIILNLNDPSNSTDNDNGWRSRMCQGNRTSVGFSPTSVLANALLATLDHAGPGVRDVMMPSHMLAIHSRLPQHPSLSSAPRQVSLYACTMSSSRHTAPLPHCPSSP